MTSPPEGVKMVMEAACIMFDEKPRITVDPTNIKRKVTLTLTLTLTLALTQRAASRYQARACACVFSCAEKGEG